MKLYRSALLAALALAHFACDSAPTDQATDASPADARADRALDSSRPDATAPDASSSEDAEADGPSAVDAANDLQVDSAAPDAAPDAEVDAAPDAEVDAEVDAAPDAEVEAAPDAELDAAPDAELDAPDAEPDAPDAELDAAPDAELDAAPDAELDAALDAEPDAAPDAAPPLAPLVTEYMARNVSTLLDEDGDSSDWIELYNPHAEPVSLLRFGLSDTAGGAGPWWFPERELAPHEYLLVWASAKDRAEGALHTDFRLSAEEPLSLVHADLGVVQAFPGRALRSDESYGLRALTLVAGDAVARVNTGVDGDWYALGFDDSGWLEGAMGVGFDAGGEGGPLAPRAERLRGYWSFEAVEGDRVLDGSPGGAHDGLLSEGAALSPEGSGRGGGRALGGGQGWMAVQDPQAFDFAQDFTWSLWMKGADGSGALISRNPAGTAWNRGSKALFVRGNTVQWDSGWVGNPRSGVEVIDDAWHHVAVTYQAEGDVFRLFVDGAARVDQAFDVNAFAEDLDHNGGRAETGIFVGQAFFSGGLNSLDNYGGLIDEVAIWDVALEPDEIAALFEGAPPAAGGPFAALIATELADTSSGQLRLRFESPEPLDALALGARYDDGVFAWLNGSLVLAANATPGEAVADGPRDDGDARQEEEHGLPAELQPENLLAIQGLAAEADADRWLVAATLRGLSLAQAGRLERPTPGAFNALGVSPEVELSVPSGVFSEAFPLELSTAEPAPIHYTLDGSDPTPDAPLYEAAIVIDTPGVVSARAFLPDRAPGPITRARYVSVTPELAARRSSLPILLIDRLGEGNIPKGVYVSGMFLAFEGGDLSAPAEVVSELAIKVRGQSSSNQPKKPYRLELRDAEGSDLSYPLLGMPADADWVLHAPFTDKSLVRNKLFYDLGREIGMESPRAQHCELYLNQDGGPLGVEDLRGVYLLVERVEVNPDRLAITELAPDDEDPEHLPGGYLMKFEAGVARPPIAPGWNTLEVVGEPSAAQLEWIGEHLATFRGVLGGEDFADPELGYAAWIETQSFIDLLVINELSRDQDAYVRSAYVHKDREGPLVAGPLWDYNLAAGTGGYFDNTNTQGWQYQHRYNGGEHGWFQRLMADPVFAAAFAARWFELRAGLLSDEAIAARIDAYAEPIGEAAPRNFAIWANLPEGRVNGFVSPTAPTWDGQLDALRDWLVQRSAWIDAQLE